MKPFTDIEQSQKLAKILPSESADMWWSKNFIYYNPTAAIGISAEYSNVYTYKFGEDDIPCWSLAALLELMPKQFGRYTKSLYWFDNTWHCDYMDEDSESKIGVSADNPIDACIKMIYKLKEICAI